MIDWESDESYTFINPRLTEITKIEPTLKGHIFLTTSGTKSLKWVALSKKAFLISAAAVNQHLSATLKDVWINALPHFHVGGLTIYARAYLSKSALFRYDLKWNPQQWATLVQEKRGTLASLVPTQLYDLLEAKIPAPPSLRIVLIGGQHLPDTLYTRAKNAGYPLMTTYGMTEMCSQVATSSLDSPTLKLLPHVQAKTCNSRLFLKSPALFTGYFSPEFHDPKQDGWFETGDLAELDNQLLSPLGRSDDLIKIHGELVNLYQLGKLLDELKYRLHITCETALVPCPDSRAGHQIHLYHSPYDVKPLIDEFNQLAPPFSRILASKELLEMPKNSLGKITLYIN